jgi:hypothetical protein
MLSPTTTALLISTIPHGLHITRRSRPFCAATTCGAGWFCVRHVWHPAVAIDISATAKKGSRIR